MYTAQQKEVLELLRDFLIKNNILKEYCISLNHPKIYHGDYEDIYADNLVNIFNWADTKRITGIGFINYHYSWHRELSYMNSKFLEIRIPLANNRKDLIDFLLKPNKNAGIIKLAKSKFMEQL